MAGEIIRLGDPTSHGGKVLEGSLVDICHGKPIAFVGHKTSCPKCKGTFPIIEGAPITTFYGKGVALAGMRTACGAVLIATQFTDIVETGSTSRSGDVARAEDQRGKSSASGQVTAELQSPSWQPVGADPTEFEQYFEAVDATGAPVALVYRINSGKSKLTEAPFSPSGTTQAFPLDLETELVFWKTCA